MKIHCIGIGGIGVSSLAQYYLAKGHEVSGSDLASSEVTEFLSKKGVAIMIGNKAEHIKRGVDLIVYSPAVQRNNPEYQKAKELGIPLQSYPQAIGDLTKKYYTIAVSGSHGKSTTTAMIGLILKKAGLDPTVIVGTKLKEFGNSNFRAGKSRYLVVEACEYDDSFLFYSPNIIVVTNIDREHLDYFKRFSNVVKAFKKFIAGLPQEGYLISNRDNKQAAGISKGKFNTVYYSLRQKEAGTVKNALKIPGRHNVSNALAALAVARVLDIPDTTSLKALSRYRGSWRRFEIIKTAPYTIISDYGHHPNEIQATLQAAREKYPKKSIWLIYQPHQYQRTHYLFDDFVKVFVKSVSKKLVDHVVITDIYDVAGREENKISSNTSSENLVKKINKKNIKYLPIDIAEAFVKSSMKSGEVLIVMGAGDIYKICEKF